MQYTIVAIGDDVILSFLNNGHIPHFTTQNVDVSDHIVPMGFVPNLKQRKSTRIKTPYYHSVFVGFFFNSRKGGLIFEANQKTMENMKRIKLLLNVETTFNI